LLWAAFFTLFDLVNPGAFQLPGGDSGGSTEHALNGMVSSDMLYFSPVTLTTLGYGDIVPASRMARILAVLEAMAGQIYLTVLVARLVGLHISHSVSDESG
jgi:voltage-gated potassium channel Kch